MGHHAERSSGRGGRGWTSWKDHNTQIKKKKTLEDYYFYVGSDKQASDFETVGNANLNGLGSES